MSGMLEAVNGAGDPYMEHVTASLAYVPAMVWFYTILVFGCCFAVRVFGAISQSVTPKRKISRVANLRRSIRDHPKMKELQGKCFGVASHLTFSRVPNSNLQNVTVSLSAYVRYQ